MKIADSTDGWKEAASDPEQPLNVTISQLQKFHSVGRFLILTKTLTLTLYGSEDRIVSTKKKYSPRTREEMLCLVLEHQIMELECENRELKRANEILRKESTIINELPPGFSVQL